MAELPLYLALIGAPGLAAGKKEHFPAFLGNYLRRLWAELRHALRDSLDVYKRQLLIYRQDDDSIKNFDYTTLNGKKIGVLKKATSKIERLEKFLTFNKIECELVYYESLEDYESCLEKQEVDLLYGNDVYMKEGYNVCLLYTSRCV